MGESSAGCVVCLCCILICCYASDGGYHHQIVRGQCYAYCLTQYSRQTDSEISLSLAHKSSTRHAETFRKCKEEKACKWCLYVCDRRDVKHYTSLHHCRNYCQYCYERWCRSRNGEITDSCNKTCGFLHRVASTRVGVCGDLTSLTDFRTQCRRECETDEDCSRNKQCCHHDCASTCQNTLNDEKLPPTPEDILFESQKDGSMLVKWKKGRNDERRDRIVPELYLIQYWLRSSSSSKQHRIIPRTWFKIYKLPGSRYKFKIAAINIHGSSGYSSVKFFTIPITKLPKPVNLDVVNERARYINNTVDLTITWQPPRSTFGLPIQKYLVYWVNVPDTSTSYLRQDFTKKSVTAHRNQFTLHHLKTGSVYLVQVRALVIFNGNQIKGQPASLHIETYSPPSSVDSRNGWSSPHNSNDIYNITVVDSYFHQGSLKAVVTWKTAVSSEKYMLFWKAESCSQSSESSHFEEKSATSHTLEFELYNLQFECNYVVRIHSIDKDAKMMSPAVNSFLTPICQKVRVKGHGSPTCQDEELDQPKNVNIEFNGDMCSSLSVVVTWNPEPWKEGRKHLVLWGTSIESTISAVIYTSQPHKIISSGNVNKVILSKVEYSQHYTVQISIQAMYGTGLPVIKNFITPSQTCTPTTTAVYFISSIKSANISTSAKVTTELSEKRSGVNSIGHSVLYSRGIIYRLTLLILMYSITQWF